MHAVCLTRLCNRTFASSLVYLSSFSRGFPKGLPFIISSQGYISAFIDIERTCTYVSTHSDVSDRTGLSVFGGEGAGKNIMSRSVEAVSGKDRYVSVYY